MHPLRLCLCLSLATALPLLAQDLPSVNADSILKELDTLEQQQKSAQQNARQVAINRLKSAAISGSSAVDLYIEAVEAVEFEGKPNKGAVFTDWKSTNGDALRNNDTQDAIQLHLKYLVMSMERANSKADLFVAPAINYVNELVELSDRIGSTGPAKPDRPDKKDGQGGGQRGQLDAKKTLLDKPISDSIFTKWMRLGPWLPKADEWELTAGNVSGIVEKDIRAPLRAMKNPQIIQIWDFEMKLLADKATAGHLDSLAADFNTLVRPKMLFQRANDYVVIGQKNRGVSEIYTLVKTYPQHPDFGKWVARLRELLPRPAPAPEAAAPAAPTAAPETAPQ